MPSSTVENYLKQIFLTARESEESCVPMGQVAQAMQVVPGTATTMIKSLAKSGLVEYTPRIGVSLTQEGEAIAIQMLRRHRLIEYFLVETLGMDWSEIHEEAEDLEHAISDRVLNHIDAFLGHPTTDPHGDIIPSANGEWKKRVLEPLSEVDSQIAVKIARVKDQDAEFLKFAETSGLMPGTRVNVIERNMSAECVVLNIDDRDQSLTLGMGAAEKILVERL
ncbi:MAG: metal-dependent transcriptional regulator [Opitutales bacterium]